MLVNNLVGTIAEICIDFPTTLALPYKPSNRQHSTVQSKINFYAGEVTSCMERASAAFPSPVAPSNSKICFTAVVLKHLEGQR